MARFLSTRTPRGVLFAACLIAVAGCGSQSPTPTPSVAPSTAASAAPSSSPSAAAASPSSAPAGMNPVEAALLASIRPDAAVGCKPLRTGIPKKAAASIRCFPGGDVARVTVTSFLSQKAMLAAYQAALAKAGLTENQGSGCVKQKPYEGPYQPGGNAVPARNACHVGGNGKAQYIATQPPKVLIVVDGSGNDARALDTWAWKGNQDQPGSPTVWQGPTP